ncbi:MAG: hypothetical protein HY000_41245 [Planctomycetes bacterium]|nr:hypothetical protein [Planctomycetota bacterium]
MRPRLFAAVFGMIVIGAMAVAGLPALGGQAPKPAPQPMITTGGETAAATACTPCIVYRGCPAPCNVEKEVSVCHPCCGTTQVKIKVPQGECEKVRVASNGSAYYHYGRYGVHVTWVNGGSKLVVRYHG